MKSQTLALVALLGANGDFTVASDDHPKYTLSKEIFGNTETIDFIDEIVPSEFGSVATNFEDEVDGPGNVMCNTTEGKLLEHITETLTSTGYENLDTDFKKIQFLNIRIDGFLKKINDCNITDSSVLEALGVLIDFKDILEVEEGAEDCTARGEMKKVLASHCDAMSSAKVQAHMSGVLSSKIYQEDLETDRQKVCFLFRAIRRYSRLIDHCDFVGEDMDDTLQVLRDYNDVLAAGQGMAMSDCDSKCPKKSDSQTPQVSDSQTPPVSDSTAGSAPESPAAHRPTGTLSDKPTPRPKDDTDSPSAAPVGDYYISYEEPLVTKNAYDDVSKIMDKLNDIYDEISESMGMP